MARISMRNVQKPPFSEYFDLYRSILRVAQNNVLAEKVNYSAL